MATGASRPTRPRACSAPPRPPRCARSRRRCWRTRRRRRWRRSTAARDGEDLAAFTRDVIELLRRALVLKAAPTAKLADVTHVEGNELRRLGEAVGLDEILYVLRVFLDADEAMRESPHPRVELEMATVRATRRPAPPALEEVLKRVDEVAQRLRQGGAAAPAAGLQASLLGDDRRAAATRPAVTEAPRPTFEARPAGGRES